MADIPFIPVLHGAAADRPDEADTLATADAVAASLRRLGYDTEVVHVGLDLTAVRRLAGRQPVQVFNLVEALEGDAALAVLAPAALEHCGLAYTGSNARAHRLTLSKPEMKERLAGAGLPTPDWSRDGAGLGRHRRVIVKSETEHASVGLDAASVVCAAEAGEQIRLRAARFGGRFFAETFVEGREFNLSVLAGRDGPTVLPPAETVFMGFPCDRPRIVDYEAKWVAGSFAYANTPRRFDFPPEDALLLDRLRVLALDAWRLFGLAGYARVDFRADGEGTPWILEANVNPCLAPDAGFVAAAAQVGIGYDALIGRIVSAASGAQAGVA